METNPYMVQALLDLRKRLCAIRYTVWWCLFVCFPFYTDISVYTPLSDPCVGKIYWLRETKIHNLHSSVRGGEPNRLFYMGVSSPPSQVSGHKIQLRSLAKLICNDYIPGYISAQKLDANHCPFFSVEWSTGCQIAQCKDWVSRFKLNICGRPSFSITQFLFIKCKVAIC